MWKSDEQAVFDDIYFLCCIKYHTCIYIMHTITHTLNYITKHVG
jgi:hypothetical protein